MNDCDIKAFWSDYDYGKYKIYRDDELNITWEKFKENLKMKEENKEDVGATAFDLPNSQNPLPHHNIYYGNQYVPRPTNAKAKIVNPMEIMEQVLKAK